MYKPALGFVTGGILAGLLLIFFGQYLFPDVIRTFMIAVVIGLGFLLGLFIGYLILKVPSPAISITWSVFIGAIGFFIMAITLAGHLLFSIIGGAFTGLITGVITSIWGTDHFQTP